MKILIADDNPRIREIIIRHLNFLPTKIEIIECSDGDEAVDLFKKNLPDLVLMDIVMNRMDGLIATKKILEINNKAVVIVITQLPEEEYKQEALNYGASEFINKENLSDLIKILEKFRTINENETK